MSDNNGSTTTTRQMKLAKTNHEEIDKLRDRLSEIEWLGEELSHCDFDEIDFSECEFLQKIDTTDCESFLKDLCRGVSAVHFQRILMNCAVMLDNCADPDLPHLDFNKDIKTGLELLEKSKQP